MRLIGTSQKLSHLFVYVSMWISIINKYYMCAVMSTNNMTSIQVISTFPKKDPNMVSCYCVLIDSLSNASSHLCPIKWDYIISCSFNWLARIDLMTMHTHTLPLQTSNLICVGENKSNKWRWEFCKRIHFIVSCVCLIAAACSCNYI